MVKKTKKSKTVEQKARVAAKQSKKAAQKDKKVRSKGGEDSEDEDVDLESVLEEYAKRVSFLLCAKIRHIILFCHFLQILILMACLEGKIVLMNRCDVL